MARFGDGEKYDRARILDAAARARLKNRRRRAVALYRWLLAVEPRNPNLHARLAPLLAETGQEFDAWLSFHAVARACLRERQNERALSVYRDAAHYLPRDYRVWHAIARLEQRRGHPETAVEVLLEGARQMRRPDLRPHAIHLLRAARELEPWHFDVVLELSRLLTRTDQLAEARLLLQGLAAGCSGERLRRVRAAELRGLPSPGALWRWLRAALFRPAESAGGALSRARAPRGSRATGVPG